jgi:hypothetical protein
MNKYFFCLIIVFLPTASHAYLGPGMAGGLIAATIGFIAAIFLAIGSILYFSIKRALKNRKKKNASKENK